jgi:hypothetical protein
MLLCTSVLLKTIVKHVYHFRLLLCYYSWNYVVKIPDSSETPGLVDSVGCIHAAISFQLSCERKTGEQRRK